MKKSVIAIFLLLIAATAVAQSSYINKVWEYCPAPGQFVNTMPEYEPGDSPDAMRQKAEELIANKKGSLVCLGGYGGYIVFSFDHMVENKPGQYDIQILGNAYNGNSEPGIVMVSYDANGNGQPDDPWYELAGSEYSSPNTIHNYTITYYRPDENKPPTPHPTDEFITDITYVKWMDNQGEEGYVYRNSYHTQPYYPLWIDSDELQFSGTRLADNYVDTSGVGRYYVLSAYPWGYADNHLNSAEESKLNINWAVDANGNPANLPGAHFFKVYTGVNQYCGWIGETSTEITGAYDLHIYGGDTDDPNAYTNAVRLPSSSTSGQQQIFTTLTGIHTHKPSAPGIYIINGKKIVIK
ncbi:MAG: hypothetical protein J5506_05800 [Prevotella sp.]|nr:hypothetical protein [Prevotella sp.]